MLADAPGYNYDSPDSAPKEDKAAKEKPTTKKGLSIFKDQNDANVKDFILKNSK